MGIAAARAAGTACEGASPAAGWNHSAGAVGPRGSCGGKRDPESEGGSVGGASGGGGGLVGGGGGGPMNASGGGGGTSSRTCASAGARVGVGHGGAGQLTCEGTTAAWA